ncbi:MAG TPA: isoleucine--tRNA ligase [Sulfurivirga caldicuralii]|nr:isoleucine--tRNA ligase [Sulfurivirga caldicuralii]
MADDKKQSNYPLNLPQTDFPMRGNLPKREPVQVSQWLQEGLYQKVRRAKAGKPKFVLHDGPPYANGNIHIGHAVNKVLKDIIVKAKGFAGFDAPYVPGWDCHGLPIELNVEKKLGKVGDKVDARTFRQACRDYAQQQVEAQMADFQRLGVLADWDNPYLTKDFRFEADEVRALGRMLANGHITRGVKPVYWSVGAGSALAEAEVEYQDKVSNAIYVRFAVVDEADLLSRMTPLEGGPGEGAISVVIWTTTPWTLPANLAVALNPELEYVLVQMGHERVLLAEGLMEERLNHWGVEDYAVVATAKGAALEGVKLHHPFYARVVPVILGDHVTLDAGTGCVHTAPGHGQEDFEVGQRYGLAVLCPVDSRGVFTAEAPGFAGKHVHKVDEEIIALLQEKGALVHHGTLKHSYPHCWRTKTPLIFRATSQWFISMDCQHLRQQALAAIPKVRWVPDWGRNRIEKMIEGRPDWCISRQRHWGVPITFIVHRETGELHPRMVELIEPIAQRIETGSIDAWYELDLAELIGDEAAEYEKVTDILDVWFDSGVTHFAVCARREELDRPADLYLEGSDQHRGWFQSSLLTALAMDGQAPYRQVLTHGFTVDEKGRKMSKSLGNVVAPQAVMNNFGADILRLWIAGSDYRYEMSVSDEIIKRTADSYRRIRNTARFMLANLNGFDPAQHTLDYAALLPLDQWVIGRAYQIQQAVDTAYGAYNFHRITQLVHHFCAEDLGAFYLDIIKDRQYTCQADSQPRRSAQTALYHVLEAMVRWIAPILSFTAEEIWRHMPGDRSDTIFTEEWYTGLTALDEEAPMNSAFWDAILTVRKAVNKQLEALRNAGQIKGSLTAEITLYAEEGLYDKLAALGDELHFVMITSEARVRPAAERPHSAVAAEECAGLWIEAKPTDKPKCVRCWHHRDDVGTHGDYPDLCGRCVENVAGAGEMRRFA